MKFRGVDTSQRQLTGLKKKPQIICHASSSPRFVSEAWVNNVCLNPNFFITILIIFG